jgi:hypothetical protein
MISLKTSRNLNNIAFLQNAFLTFAEEYSSNTYKLGKQPANKGKKLNNSKQRQF